MKQISKRHHYLPQFYLKGFLNENGKFAIFDKKKLKLKNRMFSPRTHFFDINRNSIKFHGVETDSLEELYSAYDSKISLLLNKIRQLDDFSSLLTAKNMLELKLFISMQFWRLPDSDKLIEIFFKDKTLKDIGIKISNRLNKKNETYKFEKKLLNDDGFRQYCRFLVIPLNTFRLFQNESELMNWRPMYVNFKENWKKHICSDSPIIFNDLFQLFQFNHDIIFPISSWQTLICLRNPQKKRIPIDPSIALMMDIAIFAQAEQFVCGPDSDYLHTIADTYYKYYKEIEIYQKFFGFLQKNH